MHRVSQQPGEAVYRSEPGHADLAIAVRGLRKRYNNVLAIDDITFSVARGEIFALLGPNGAGKTSIIEILEGYRGRDAGEVLVLGEDPGRSQALKQRIGIMLQQSAIYPNLQVEEALRLFCSYYRHAEDPQKLLALIGLEGKARARFKQLSGGQKQRLSLGLALAGKPELVFLDEPTASMDTQARLITWDVISSLRNRGASLVLTTHYLEEAQRIADTVAIVDHGKLIALGTPAELIAETGAGTVRFTAQPGLALARLERLPGALGVTEGPAGSYTLRGAEPDELLIEVAIWSRAAGIRVQNLRVERVTLEDVFLQLTGERFIEGED